MATTDTQQTAQFAAQAAVSAAEAKQYLLSIQQPVIDISESVADAQNAAAAAEMARDQAQGISTSLVQTIESQLSEQEAQFESQMTTQQSSFESSQSERESSFEEKSNEFESRFSSQLSAQESTFSESQTDKENRFQQFLNTSGYVFLGDYQDGPFQFSARNQYIRYDNEYYRLNAATDVGFTTTGTDATSFANDVTHFVLMDGDTLRQDLGSRNLPGADIVMTSLGVTIEKSTIQVDTIASLKNLFPQGSDRVYTKGAFSAGDGGADSWIFILTDQSSNVSLYPRLFIPPSTDLTGASGAWFVNTGRDLYAVSFGLGCTSDPQINKEIADQLIDYNKGKNYIVVPPKGIFVKSIQGQYSPNFKGTKGATASVSGGNGSVFMFKNADTTDPCMTFQRSSGFITGLFMEGITLVGYDAFNGVTIDTFGPRTTRKGLNLKYCGGKIELNEVFIIGISQALYLNRLQDGKLSGVRMLYCSDANGTVPSAWISTEDGTNTNFMHFEDMHIEFSPFAMYLGYSRHNKFTHCKFESQRAADATNYVVWIDASAFENTLESCMFVTTATTLRHYMLDRGTSTNIRDSWFDGTTISSDMNYPGIRWYYGNTVSVNPNNSLENCKFTRVLPGDGSDPLAYPIVLGNYQKFSGRVNVDATVTYSGGTVNLTNSGLVSIGNNCIVHDLTFSSNANAKVAGPVFYFRGTEAIVTSIEKIQGDLIYSLTGGNSNNAFHAYGTHALITSSGSIDITGKDSAIISSSTTLTRFTGLVGQVFSIVSTASGSTITYDPSYIITSSGANISMTANKAYSFLMISATKATQVGV